MTLPAGCTVSSAKPPHLPPPSNDRHLVVHPSHARPPEEPLCRGARRDDHALGLERQFMNLPDHPHAWFLHVVCKRCERASDFRFLCLRRRRNHWVRAYPFVQVDESKSVKHPFHPFPTTHQAGDDANASCDARNRCCGPRYHRGNNRCDGQCRLPIRSQDGAASRGTRTSDRAARPKHSRRTSCRRSCADRSSSPHPVCDSWCGLYSPEQFAG